MTSGGPPYGIDAMRRAVLFVLLLLLVAGTADATVRILPLGDSMTKGSTETAEEAGHPTYRYWLWQQLRNDDVDFVGSWTAPNFAVAFDQDNEGHGGYSTDEILHGVTDQQWEPGYLAEWTMNYDFDMVLLLIGTNDVLRGVPTSDTAANLEKIISVLRQKNPRVTIFMATLPPASYYRQSLIDLNQEIVRTAERVSRPESRVVVVDQYYGYDGVEDNQPPGFVHPDESGEKKIAKNWYDAITPYLSGAMPTPTPTPTQVPTIVPTPVLTPVATLIVSNPVVVAPIATEVVSIEPASRFGIKRYTIGGMAGSSRGGLSFTSGSRSSVPGSDQNRLSPGDVANGTKPPTKMFIRWYPANRWASGLR